jgi:predicted DNA-binding antitoxin AbrB/MazE fold protein
MIKFDAVYENGVLKPLTPVAFAERQRVSLTAEPEPTKREVMRAKLEKLREYQRRMKEKYGLFPDSTLSINEDRQRDI